jgi:hypothetical protein
MNLPRKKDDDAVRRLPTAIETEIAQELARLPRIEQIRTTQDVEGKNILAAAEPSKLVQLGIDAFDKQIKEQIVSTTDSSVVALVQSPFASDRKLWLKMLRAEKFDPELAAKRMINFLALLKEVLHSTDERRELRPLKLAKDFSQQEMEHQSLGAIQLLLFRDQAGRRVAGSFDVDVAPSISDTNSEVCEVEQHRIMYGKIVFHMRLSSFIAVFVVEAGVLLVSSCIRG